MKNIFTFILLISQIIVFAQTQTENLNRLLQRKTELERSISYYQKELKEVETKIQNLKQKQSQAISQPIIVSESGDKILATTNKNTVLRSSPSTNATEIMAIPANATVYIHHEHQGLYLKATYYGKEGWVNYTSINSHPEIDAMIEKPKSTTSTTTIITVDKNDPKYIRLKKIYGEEKAIKMVNKQLWKGMSHGQVRETLGKPVSQTREDTPKGLKEEWIYSNKKLTFLNGSLLSW